MTLTRGQRRQCGAFYISTNDRCPTPVPGSGLSPSVLVARHRRGQSGKCENV